MVSRIKKIFSSENSVRGASIILLITLSLSKLLGLLRDHFLATYIPTSKLDIYFAAFRIPDLLFNFLILGAISSAFIPVFCEFLSKKDLKSGWRLTNSLLNISAATMIMLAILAIIFMPYLTPLVVPDFSADKMAEMTKLSRLLMLTPILFSISYIFSGVLNSFKRFVSYSLAPIVYNFSIIIGAIFFSQSMGILGVSYFVVIGSFLHALIQLPTTISLGYRYRLIFDFKNNAVKKVIYLMIPRTIGMGVNQILLLIYTALASYLTVGSIAAFNFANNIQTMPTLVFGTSFATAVFPTLTLAYSSKQNHTFSYYLTRSIRTIAYVLIPLSAFIILLRAQIVRLILGSGYFTWGDTKATALTLGYFAISLVAQGLIPLLARAFYAMKNTKTPMLISIISVIFSVFLAYPLKNILGVAGLALSFSIGSFVNAFLLYIFLIKKDNRIIEIGFWISIIKIIFISLASALILWVTMHLMAKLVNMNTFIGILEQTLISIISGTIIYFVLSYLFKCQEIKWIIKRKINGNGSIKNNGQEIGNIE